MFGRQKAVTSLADVFNSSCRLLEQGQKSSRHPFNRPVLATMENNRPQLRTVILRAFSGQERTLICHCDCRTPKVDQILNNPKVSWLFYHPKKWVQIRLSGQASVHTSDDIAEEQWKTVRRSSRINYCAPVPPGDPMEPPAAGVTAALKEKALKMIDSSKARKNFAAIVCRFDEMEWLMLKLTGNLRAKFTWQGRHVYSSWIVP